MPALMNRNSCCACKVLLRTGRQRSVDLSSVACDGARPKPVPMPKCKEVDSMLKPLRARLSNTLSAPACDESPIPKCWTKRLAEWCHMFFWSGDPMRTRPLGRPLTQTSTGTSATPVTPATPVSRKWGCALQPERRDKARRTGVFWHYQILASP